MYKPKRGFTLVELLEVVGIIAVIAAVIFVIVDPVKRLKEARNTQRWQGVKMISDAIRLYQLDSLGQTPAGIDTTWRMLGTSTSGCNVTCSVGTPQAACIDISGALTGKLPQMPIDPLVGTATRTYYAVRRETTGVVAVAACGAEGTTITTRK